MYQMARKRFSVHAPSPKPTSTDKQWSQIGGPPCERRDSCCKVIKKLLDSFGELTGGGGCVQSISVIFTDGGKKGGGGGGAMIPDVLQPSFNGTFLNLEASIGGGAKLFC